MTRMTLAAIAALWGASASAGCFGAGTPLFQCSFNEGNRAVHVCLQGEVVLYSFGKSARAPDMVLARREIGVEMTPWNGIGRSIREEVTVHNGAYSYTVSYAIDRSDESAPAEGRLVVGEGDSAVAELICDAGSVRHADFYPLFEAKQAAGQRYCNDTFSWGAGC